MNVIKWNRSDCAKLEKAVKRFNSVVESVADTNIKKLDYNSVKGDILTRKELQRRIEKLERLTRDTINTWEEDERERDIKLAERALKAKLRRLEKDEEFPNTDFWAVKGEIRNIKNLENLPKSFRKKKLERISELASADYRMKEAKNFRDWYIRSITEKYEGFDGYDKLMSKLKKISNPISFYDKIKGSLNEADIYYIRYTNSTQQLFDKILAEWGIE